MASLFFMYFSEHLSEIETLSANFMKEKDLNLIKKSCHILIKIQFLYGLCQELGDEKIAIVQQVYTFCV